MSELFFDPAFLLGELGLAALIVVLTLADAFRKPLYQLFNGTTQLSELEYRNRQAGWLTGIGFVIVAALFIYTNKLTGGEPAILLHNSLKAGGGLLIGKLVILIAGILTLLLSIRYTSIESIPGIDYYLLLCFSLLGALTLIAAENFIMLFLALEMMSIPIYAMVGLKRYNPRSDESAIKYLLLGGFSSGFLLLGISFLYGATGSLVISDVLTSLSFPTIELATPQALFGALGLIFLFIGLAFKVSLVPFHAWTPDVYEGAATPITAFMSVAVKLSAFAVILKIFAGSTSFGGFDSILVGMLGFFALITVMYGNSVAIVQTNVKRMLAYSSIAHAGYMALAIAPMTHTVDAAKAVLFYGIGYVAMNMLAFGVLIYLTRQNHYCETLDDLKGVARKFPGAAAMMTIAMFSLAGIPPAVGFVGKIQIFMQLINAHMYITAVIALLFSFVALYFYINVLVVMYMKEPDTDKTIESSHQFPVWVAMAASALLIILLGILPTPLLNWSQQWASILF
ncbi:NADH-quinone oxidoreductase subunit N [candidate division KSB1 bacterium]|nr:NADH-quinone oxidoreductase subunit N [candidate division KSB1 bacterium]